MKFVKDIQSAKRIHIPHVWLFGAFLSPLNIIWIGLEFRRVGSVLLKWIYQITISF